MCIGIHLDQTSLTKDVAPTLNYKVSVNQNLSVVQIFGENFRRGTRDRATLSVFRSVSSSARPTVFSTVAPRGRRTPASASPHAHACRVCILAPDTPPTGARAAVALPRNRASRRQGHWPSPLPIDPSFRPLAPPLPGAVLHSSALPTSAARALAWTITLRRLAPVATLLFHPSPIRP